MRIAQRAGLVSSVTLLVMLAITVPGGQMANNFDRYAIVADSTSDKIEMYRSGLGAAPQVLRTGYFLKWVSRDGLWVGGRQPRNIFGRTPPCLYAQNVRTGEKRSYCEIVREVDQFAFTDDFRHLAVLGKPLDQANSQEPTGLFLLDLTDRTRGPVYVMRGLDGIYVSGGSFTHDGRQFTFGRGDEIFTYDLREGKLRSLGHGTNPIMSPSGSHLCYEDSAHRVVVQDLKTGHRSFVGELSTGSVQWSPDGLRVLFLRPYADAEDINAELVSFALSTQTTEVLGRMYTLGGQYWWVAP